MDKNNGAVILKPMKRIVFFFLLWLFCAGFAGESLAAGGRQVMRYAIYAGGLHALEVNVTIDTRTASQYKIEMRAQTYGLLGKLVPWQGRFFSQGRMRKAVYQPEKHLSDAVYKDERELKEYFYKNGRFQELTVNEHGKKPYIIGRSVELTDGTTDALTAGLNVFEHVAKGKPCEGHEDVFDGKRRFTQMFHDEGLADLKAGGYSIFTGPARQCTVEVIPGAGEWAKKPRGWLSIQEQGRSKGTMPTLWIAQMAKDAPAVPVRLMVKTDYGTLYMHLLAYKNES